MQSSRKILSNMKMLKTYILNLVTLLICQPIHVTYFIVFAMKQVVVALSGKNAHSANFAAIFYKQWLR